MSDTDGGDADGDDESEGANADGGDEDESADADREYAVTLEWRGGGRDPVTLAVAADEPILDAAEAAGAGLPYGCRTGACATCTARLREGSVEHRRPPRALDDESVADGYVLTCVAAPTADCRLEVGADVASDLVTNPWK